MYLLVDDQLCAALDEPVSSMGESVDSNFLLTTPDGTADTNTNNENEDEAAAGTPEDELPDKDLPLRSQQPVDASPIRLFSEAKDDWDLLPKGQRTTHAVQLAYSDYATR